MTTPKLHFKFEESPFKKGKCPKCQKPSCFRYYLHLPREFGICDHKNKCEHHHDPNKEPAEIKKELYKLLGNEIEVLTEKVVEKKLLYPTNEQLKVLSSLESCFHIFMHNKLGIKETHFQRWNVGTDNTGKTAFVMQTMAGKYLNIKYMQYYVSADGNNCKRDKKINFSLVAPDKNKEQYKTCLFGEHLLRGGSVIICLVESEKTAVLASYFYPQFDWLATGGANGLTVDKVQLLKGKQVYYLTDNDKAGKENSSIKKLEAYGIKYKIVQFEQAQESEDLADLIIRGLRPDIAPAKEAENLVFYQAIYNYNNGLPTSVKDVRINYTIWTKLLYSLGYRRFDLGVKGFIFVRVENRVLLEVTVMQIQDTFMQYLKKMEIVTETYDLVDELKDCIVEKFHKSISNFFNDKRLALLTPEEHFIFNKDTAEEAFVYYKNGYVKINKEGWELLSYSSLEGCIWQTQIRDRDFCKIEIEHVKHENAPIFSKFVLNISGNEERYNSLCSIIGYNLHNFFETKLKATILTDSSISEEAEGRTGKTLIAKSLGHIRTYTEIGGKGFDPTDKYRYADCSLDTQIVHLNDARKFFDFEILYNDITEGIKIDKKNQQPFNQHVKYILSSNKTIKMDGASSRDRSIEFELAEHYNDKFQPQDEFKHWFFRDWNKDEWYKFDNFMMYCINYFLKNGLIQAKEINLQKRKLIDQTCAEFIEFINAKEIVANTKYNRDEWHEDFLKSYPDLKEDKYKKLMKTFTSYLKIYAANSNKFDKLETGKHLTRSNNTNYVLFTLKAIKLELTE